MLNKPLERYLELYSEYVVLAVSLHNYHRSFSKNLGYETCLDVKKTGRRMNVVLKDLQKMARAAYLEHRKQTVKRGRPKGKKDGQYNNTTTKTI